jgi:hypothetical protein
MSLKTNAQEEVHLRTSESFDAPLIGRHYLPPPVGKGSPYLYDNFLNGYVVFLSGDTVRNKLFKYDCLKNDFIWMADGRSMVALDYNLIKSFTLFPKEGGERKFEKTNLKLPYITDSLFCYLEVLAKGEIDLYSLHNVEIGAEPTSGLKGGLYILNVYSPVTLYFIQLKDLPVRQVRLSKRSIYEAYPEYKEKIRNIIRANHGGGIRKEYQLTQLVKLINENWKD